MKIYVAVAHDRHLDHEIAIFSLRSKAIEWARNYMKEHVAHPEGLRESDDGNMFYISYEFESDYAFVVESFVRE